MNITLHEVRWVLIAGTFLVVPMLWFLPWWLLIVWICCLFWRWQILRARASFPNSIFMLTLGICVLAATFVTFKQLLGLDAAVTYIVALFALKILELKTSRDAWVLIFLSFIIIAVSFLLNDDIFITVYNFIALSMVLAAMVGMQKSTFYSNPFAAWKVSASLMLQSIPILVIAFVTVPRITPLWSVPTASDAKTAQTGLSDFMDASEILKVTDSNEKAFKVIFEDDVMPAKSLLYWRAMIYENYENRKWYSSRVITGDGRYQVRGEPITYSIIMEPHYRHSLFNLSAAMSWTKDVRNTEDFRLYRIRPVSQIFRYEVISYPAAILDGKLSKSRKERNLRLPKNGNPQTREFARQLQAEFDDPKELVKNVLNYFKNNNFLYTTEPDILGKDNIDDFLFGTKNGFCAHYAESLAFILRSAGIPARVVAGYFGGSWNKSGNFLQVRQSDAHAWVEYWIEGRGWQQVDPTTAVAGYAFTNDLLNDQDNASTTSDGLWSIFNNKNWVTKVVDKWDAVNHKWQITVLDYQQDNQKSLLEKLFGDADWQLIAIITLNLVLVTTGLLCLFIFKPWQKNTSPLMRKINLFERKLTKKYAVTRAKGESMSSFIRRINSQISSEHQQTINELAEYLEQVLYAEQIPNHQKIRSYLAKI